MIPRDETSVTENCQVKSRELISEMTSETWFFFPSGFSTRRNQFRSEILSLAANGRLGSVFRFTSLLLLPPFLFPF